MTVIVAYAAAAIVFFAIDYLWLSRVAFTFYRSEMGAILREKPNLAAAGAFYLFYVAGIVYFAILPALAAQSGWQALFSGALLGLLAYGTYDMTNLATVRNWSVKVTIVDTLWGATLTAIAALAGFFAAGLL